VQPLPFRADECLVVCDPCQCLGDDTGRDSPVQYRAIQPDAGPAIGMQDVNMYRRVFIALYFDKPVARAVECAHI